MKKYLIYTVNDTNPFVVETEEDLIHKFDNAVVYNHGVMYIEHTKNLMAGKFNYEVLLNVNNIVSITTSEKV